MDLLSGRRIGIIHPYPSARVLEQLLAHGCQIVLAGAPAPSGLCVEAVLDAPLTDATAVVDAFTLYHARHPLEVMLPLYEGSTALTARIADRLGLRGARPEAAERSRNKYATYCRLHDAGVAVPRTVPITSVEDARNVTAELGYPAIVKLADSMNSQGVARVDDEAACASEIRGLLGLLSRPRDVDALLDRNRLAYGQGQVRIIAQSFCEGSELNVDLLFDADSHRVLGVFEKAQSSGPYFPEHMSVSPTSLTSRQEHDVCDLSLAAVRALGLGLGAAHVEIRYADGQPRVLEVGARPGGGLTVDAVQSLTGLHPVVELARLLLGGPLPPLRSDPGRAVLYGGKVYDRSGLLRRVDGVEHARALEGISNFTQLHRAGDPVFAMPDSAQPHFCYYLVEGTSREQVLATHARACELIELEIAPFERAQELRA